MSSAALTRISKHLIIIRPVNYSVLLKLTVGLLIFFCLVSHHTLDPSPLNLLMPSEGIHNWLSLPGALFSGLLFDFLGILAFTVPFLVIFLTRHKKHFSLLLLFPEIIEILTFTASIALLISPESPSGFWMTGIWGNVSASALNQFPGMIYAIPVLLCYQLFYFYEHRLDLTLPMVLGAVALTGYFLLKQIVNRGMQTIQKSAKYSAINWISPAVLSVSKIKEASFEKLSKRYQLARATLEDTNPLEKAMAAMGNLVGKKEHAVKENDQLTRVPSSDLMDQMIAQAIQEYRRSHYLLDGKTFLKLEEEI